MTIAHIAHYKKPCNDGMEFFFEDYRQLQLRIILNFYTENQ